MVLTKEQGSINIRSIIKSNKIISRIKDLKLHKVLIMFIIIITTNKVTIDKITIVVVLLRVHHMVMQIKVRERE